MRELHFRFSAGTFFFPPHHHIENALWSFPFCFTITEKDNLSCKELRECKITCHYPVNGNIKKSLSAEIVVGQLWVLKTCRNALLFLPFHIKFKSCSEADDHSRRVTLAVVSWLLASAGVAAVNVTFVFDDFCGFIPNILRLSLMAEKESAAAPDAFTQNECAFKLLPN